MRWIKWLFFIGLMSACSKKNDYSSIDVIGHAGMGLTMFNSMYHDNSKEAVEYALSMSGTNGVEVDVQISADGELWLYHDPKLESQTNSTGCISEKNYSELNTIKYTSWNKEKLTRLIDIDWTLLIGKTIYLDVRNLNFCTNSFFSSVEIIQSLEQIPFLKNGEIEVIIVSSDKNLLQSLIQKNYTTGYELSNPNQFETIHQCIPEISHFIIKNKDIEISQVEKIQSFGKHVIIFEMRSAEGIRKALRKNPNAIMTDDLREALIEVD